MRFASHLLSSYRRAAIVLAIGITISVAITLLLGAVAQPRVELNQISLDPNTGQRLYQGLPFSGIVISHYPSGQLATEEGFSKGRRHGVFNKWFSSGQLAYQAHYLQGQRHGSAKSWWDNGKLRSQSEYRNNLVEGDSWEWYQTGELFKQFHFVAGEYAGLQKGWRTNGKLFINFEYKNGRIYGLYNADLCLPVEN